MSTSSGMYTTLMRMVGLLECGGAGIGIELHQAEDLDPIDAAVRRRGSTTRFDDAVRRDRGFYPSG